MTYALDYLGLGSKYWPLHESIEYFPHGWGLGCFDSTFGNVMPNLIQFLDSGKVSMLRVHLWWSDAHKIAPLSIVKSRAPAYEALAIKYPNIKIFISHSCEYLAKSTLEVKQRVDIIHRLAPHCFAVNTPMRSVVTADARHELHGKNAIGHKGDFVSLDGDDAFMIDGKGWVKKNKRADFVALWISSFNLRRLGVTPKPPPQRKEAPTVDEFIGVVNLTK